MENTDYTKAVAGVLIKDGKVLLARHTYGNGNGLLIIPGGYIEKGESPEDAVKREYMEEVSLEVSPKSIVGIRFNQKDWYLVFSVEYVSGVATSDNDENSEVLWLPIDEALYRDDVPGLSKELIISATRGDGLVVREYKSRDDQVNIVYSV